jgi:O-acetyl-ADP-ribose deacetylase (regulator of RNase III)
VHVIHFLSGDILNSRARALAHGVAPGDHFDSGLALALRERWPAMVKDFRHHCQVSNPKTGEAWTWAGPDGKRIVNLLTQEPAPGHHGRPGRATVAHVNHALRELRHVAEKEAFASLALPRLATGVGGLDWKDVKPLVERHLGDLTIPIFVYEIYQPGVTTKEPAHR